MQGSTAAIMQAGNLYMYTMHNPVAWIDPSGLVGVLLRDVMDRYNEIRGGDFSYTIRNLGERGRFLDVTIGDITNSYRIGSRDAYFIGDILIFESDRLVEDFGLPRWWAEHQPHFSQFSSPDHAALAWSLKYWALSTAEYAEFTSNIYRSAQGRYFFSAATFLEAGVDNRQRRVSIQPARDGFERVAIIHTHIQLRWPITYGYVIPGETSWFSPQDRFVATSQGVPLYMAAPNNTLRVLNPGDRFGSTVFRNLRY